MKNSPASGSSARNLFYDALTGALSIFNSSCQAPNFALDAFQAVLDAGLCTRSATPGDESEGKFLAWAGSLVSQRASSFDRELARRPQSAARIRVWRETFVDAFCLAIRATGAPRVIAATTGPAWMVELCVEREALSDADRWACVDKMSAWSTFPKLAHLGHCLPAGQTIFSLGPNAACAVSTAFSSSLWQKAEREALAVWLGRRISFNDRASLTSYLGNYWNSENGPVVLKALANISPGGTFDPFSAIGMRMFAPSSAASASDARLLALLSPGMIDSKKGTALILLAPEHNVAWAMAAVSAACEPSVDVLGAGLLRLGSAASALRAPLAQSCLAMATRLSDPAAPSSLLDAGFRRPAARSTVSMASNPFELALRACLSNKPKNAERESMAATLSLIVEAGFDPWLAPPEGGLSPAAKLDASTSEEAGSWRAWLEGAAIARAAPAATSPSIKPPRL